MRRIIAIVMVVAFALGASAQSKGYVCTYEMTMSIGDKLGDLEDGPIKDAIMAQMSSMKMYFTLTYVDGRSLFVPSEDGNDNPFAGQASHIVYTDYSTRQQVTQETFFGHSFLIPEEMPVPQWNLTAEQKQIAGRACTKATIGEDGHVSVAWFSPETPIPAGPMGYWGLPGLIVKLEIEGATYTLSDIRVVDDPKPLKAPTKGKKMTREEYNALMQEKLQQMGVGGGNGGVHVIQMN